MKGLNEETIAKINDPEKLQYLLSGVVQKNAKLIRKTRILQKQIKNAKSELSSCLSELTKCRIDYESNQFYKTEHEFEKIRADYNEYAFTSLFNIVQNLNLNEICTTTTNIDNFLKQLETFQKEFREKKKEQIEDFKLIISNKDKIIIEKDHQINELKESIEKIESSPIPKEIEDMLSEKDQSIAKLRNLIQKYAKNDQIKQQQIDEQQIQIQQLLSNSKLNSSTKANFSNNISLEQEVNEIRVQLSQISSKDAQEIESKNEKLKSMLEKSNKLYTQLNEKYISLQQSVKNRKNTKLSINQNLLFEVMSSSSNLHKANSMKKSKKGLNNESTIIISLRKTLLQYFLTDEENQENLIPVILEIVGCNKEQIEGAISNYKRHQHLINKAGSFFGLFG